MSEREVQPEDTIGSNIGSLRDAMLAELERLRQIMNGDIIENDENYLNLTEDEKETFNNFLDFYSECPICKKSNHKYYLKRFYFDENPFIINLKKILLKILNDPEDFKTSHFNKISYGIPCCECFNLIFKKSI